MWLESFLGLVRDLVEFVRGNPLLTSMFLFVIPLANALFSWFIYRARLSDNRRFEAAKMSDAHYAEIDDAYFRLLQMRVDRPHLAEPEICLERAEWRESYNQYAFMVWNFLETIYDRFYEKPQCEPHRRTWQPIIENEGSLHLAWFSRPENGGPIRGKFKKEFVDFICFGGFVDVSESGQFAREARAAIAPMLEKERAELAVRRKTKP